LSDISWNEPGEQAVRQFTKGDEIETVILSIDAERERISLGLKQLEEDPFTNYVAINDRGTIVKGKVKEVEPKHAVIEIADEVDGILKASEISVDRVEDARNALSVGDDIEVKIISVDRKNRILGVSIKAKDIANEELAVKEHKERDSDVNPTTFGDLIKQQMDQASDAE
jgi:small subunit ribosomal protein S1